VARILARVVHQDPLPPTRLDPALPAAVDDLVARALAKAPEDRYQEARHLAEDAEDVLAGVTPRHRVGWTSPPPTLPPEKEPTLIAELGPAALMPTITVVPATGSGEVAPPLPPPLAPGRRGAGRRLPPRTIALLAVIGLALGGLLWSRLPSSPSPSSPVPPPSVAPPTPLPTPEPTPVPTPAPARIVVDVRQPLESGRLRVWLDGEELLVEQVRGDVTRNLVLFKLKGGVVTEVLDVSPGRHRFRVEVSWDDERRSADTSGRLETGETYRLEVRLGRIGKDLSLRWTR
jgi:hypothetical protein